LKLIRIDNIEMLSVVYSFVNFLSYLYAFGTYPSSTSVIVS